MLSCVEAQKARVLLPKDMTLEASLDLMDLSVIDLDLRVSLPSDQANMHLQL